MGQRRRRQPLGHGAIDLAPDLAPDLVRRRRAAAVVESAAKCVAAEHAAAVVESKAERISISISISAEAEQLGQISISISVGQLGLLGRHQRRLRKFEMIALASAQPGAQPATTAWLRGSRPAREQLKQQLAAPLGARKEDAPPDLKHRDRLGRRGLAYSGVVRRVRKVQPRSRDMQQQPAYAAHIVRRRGRRVRARLGWRRTLQESFAIPTQIQGLLPLIPTHVVLDPLESAHPILGRLVHGLVHRLVEPHSSARGGAQRAVAFSLSVRIRRRGGRASLVRVDRFVGVDR